MKKRKLLIVATVIIITCIVVIIALGKSQETSTLRIGYSSQSLNYSSVMVAEEAGFFKEHGADVELVPFASGTHTRLALSTGNIDAAFLNVADFLVAIGAGAPVKIIAPIAQTTTLVFVRPNDGIETFEDLRGKKILGQVNTSRYNLIHALAQEGITDPDLTFLDIDSEYRTVALMQQKVFDAVPTSRHNESSWIKAGAVILREWDEKGYSNKFNPHMYIGVNTDYFPENKAQVERALDAIVDAQKYILHDPQVAAELVRNHIDVATDGISDLTIPYILNTWTVGTRGIVWSDPQEVVEIANFLYTLGELKNSLSIDQIFDFQFREKLERYQETFYNE